MTLQLEIDDADFKRISEYAAENKIGVSELFFKTVLEKIEDAEWDSVSKKLIERNKRIYEELAK